MDITRGRSLEKALAVGPEAAAVDLRLTADAELQSARLELEADSRWERMQGNISSVNGQEKEGPIEGKSRLTKGISWLVVDLGQDCLVKRMDVEVNGQNGKDLKMRIRGFYNNAWTPLMPVDLFSIEPVKENRVNFTPVTASRLMVEFIKAAKTSEVILNVKKLTLCATRLPCRIELKLAEEVLLTHEDLLPPGEKVSIKGFPDKVNRYLAEHSGTGTVPMTLRCAAPARIMLRVAGIKTGKVVRQFVPEGRFADLELAYGQSDPLRIALDAGVTLTDVRFAWQADLLDERIVQQYAIFAPGVLSHLCDARHSAAQSFSAPSGIETLMGFDLCLRPAQAPVKAWLNIHADTARAPRQDPFPNGRMSLEIDDRQSVFQWMAFRPDAPFSLPAGRWWAVLTVLAGELHWQLADITTTDCGCGEAAVNRIKDHPWQPRDGYTGCMRIIVGGATRPEVTFTLGRGDRSVSLSPGNGQVYLNQKQLAALNQDNIGELELRACSNGRGRVLISNLQIRIGSS